MGIYIPNMEMPKTCQICRTAKFDRIVGCEEWDRLSIAQRMYMRSETCPLIPLPEGHGRLVDAERFRVILCRLKEKQNDDVATHALNWAIECLDKMDTIIPAEGGTDDV